MLLITDFVLVLLKDGFNLKDLKRAKNTKNEAHMTCFFMSLGVSEIKL